MKKKLLCLIGCFCLLIAGFMQFYVNERSDPLAGHWAETIDENGYPVEVLNLSDEDIAQYQISQLKQKYKDTNQSIFTYQLQHTDFDTESFNVLFGVTNQVDWGQRSSYAVGNKTIIPLQANAKSLLDRDYLTYNCSADFIFDPLMDSQLGGFGKIKTNTYLVTATDPSSGKVLSTYTEVVPIVIEKSLKPVYVKENREIVFYHLNELNRAMIINTSIAPTDNSHFRIATRDDF